MSESSLSIGFTGLEQGTVVSRPNRFVALVRLGEQEVLCHVADSGRLKELIFPGNPVMVRKASSATETSVRKTQYDLVLASTHDARSTSKFVWVSVDTRYPNLIFGQALRAQAIREMSGHNEVKSEYWYHYLSPWKEEAEREASKPKEQARPVRSRMDFLLDGPSGTPAGLVEVKSVTLCRDGVGFFPDAPTERGARHLHELVRGVKEGYRAYAVFIAQREDIETVEPNREMDPAFARALKEAQGTGVRLLGFRCSVTGTEICLDPAPIPVVV